MGQVSSNESDSFTIEFNNQLNSQLIHNINSQSSKDEVTKFKRFINKQFKKEFTPSNFSSRINANGKAFNIAMQLIDFIYTKSTKKEILKCNNCNLYTTVFNYNIISKESIEYEKFNKKTLSSFDYIMPNAALNFNHLLCNTISNSSIARDKEKKSDIISNPVLSKSKIELLREENKKNDISSDDEITSMIDVNTIKPTSIFKNRMYKKSSNRKIDQHQDDTETINLADESFNHLCVDEERPFNDDENEQIIHFAPHPSLQKTRFPDGKKKKHKALPTKSPIVNIKLQINDLLKQNRYENNVLEPDEKYKDQDKNRQSKSKDNDKYKFNQTNANHLNISTNINDITVIKPNSSVANVNDNSSFLSIVDAFTQGNKKAKDVIHSKTPAKSKGMQNLNYLKGATSKSSEKNKSNIK